MTQGGGTLAYPFEAEKLDDYRKSLCLKPKIHVRFKMLEK